MTMTLASTYARFAPLVRRRLADLGVREADLPDLCQEVFLVVQGKGDVLAAIDRLDLWLGEICRRVAAGYRRRAEHRLEVLGCDAEERAHACADRDEDADVGDRLRLLRQALNHLDDESRDLLALHHGGEMPLSDLARLVAHDRKTVRSRLARARRRVSRWLCDDEGRVAGLPAGAPARTTPPQSPFMRDQAARGRAAGFAARELEILRVAAPLCSGAIGNVTICDWRGPQITPALIDSAMERAPYTLETCGGEITFVALIEPTVCPPSLETRRKIADALDVVGPYFGSFAVVLLAANARINQPILQGLTLLARSRFPMQFFASVTAAAEWLCATTARGPRGPLEVDELTAAIEHVRRLDADRLDDRRRARNLDVVSA
jgi:RNA polymerase sigma-70 factor (ECF subfamily)